MKKRTARLRVDNLLQKLQDDKPVSMAQMVKTLRDFLNCFYRKGTE